MSLTRKNYTVKYDRKIGGVGHVNIKARNANEAISNAKNIVATGKNFKVLKNFESKYKFGKGSGVKM